MSPMTTRRRYVVCCLVGWIALVGAVVGVTACAPAPAPPAPPASPTTEPTFTCQAVGCTR